MAESTKHNLYEPDSKRYIAEISIKNIVWVSDRKLARNFNKIQIFFLIKYLNIRFGLKTRRSSFMSFETKLENKVDMK